MRRNQENYTAFLEAVVLQQSNAPPQLRYFFNTRSYLFDPESIGTPAESFLEQATDVGSIQQYTAPDWKVQPINMERIE